MASHTTSRDGPALGAAAADGGAAAKAEGACVRPHALHAHAWAGIRDRVMRVKANGGRVLVALDYDGTLAPIVNDPALAFAPDTTLATLRRLRANAHVLLAIVTGRCVLARSRPLRAAGIMARALAHVGVCAGTWTRRAALSAWKT